MKGWHSKGYLPHIDGGEVLQFVTVHQGDAFPQKDIERWKLETARNKEEAEKIYLGGWKNTPIRDVEILFKAPGDCRAR